MTVKFQFLYPVPSPSSYKECLLFGRVSIKDKEDTEHTQGDFIFTPLYAFYSPLPTSKLLHTLAPGPSDK